MNEYFISPFFEFKRVFGKCYAEHKYTRQILLLPCEVQTHFLHPMNRLLGLDDTIIAELKNFNVFDFLCDEKLILDKDVPYKELSGFFVRPQYSYLGLPIGNMDELADSFAVFGVPFFFGNPSLISVHEQSTIARNYSQKYNLQQATFLSAEEIRGTACNFAGGTDIFDLGDIYINQREDISVTLQKISDVTQTLSQNGNRFIAIGGDHSVTYPLFKGVQKEIKDLVCVQIDAHNDLFLLTECHFSDLAPSHSSVMGKLLSEGVEVYSLGIRDFVNVDSLSMAECELYTYKFSSSDQQFLADIDAVILQLSNKKIYLTVDMDVIDPKLFGSVTDPLPNGITFETLVAALARLRKGTDIVAIDIVEAVLQVNNVIDTHDFLNFLTEVIAIFYERAE